MARQKPRTFTFDPTGLSVADMIEAAELTGVDPLAMDRSPGPGKMRYTAALAWIYNRADDPGLTFEDVLQGRVVGEVAENGTAPPAQAGS